MCFTYFRSTGYSIGKNIRLTGFKIWSDCHPYMKQNQNFLFENWLILYLWKKNLLCVSLFGWNRHWGPEEVFWMLSIYFDRILRHVTAADWTASKINVNKRILRVFLYIVIRNFSIGFAFAFVMNCFENVKLKT